MDPCLCDVLVDMNQYSTVSGAMYFWVITMDQRLLFEMRHHLVFATKALENKNIF